MTKLKPYKVLNLEAKDFKEGDIVFSKYNAYTYVVYSTGVSLLHRHPYIKIFYPEGNPNEYNKYFKKHYVHEIDGKRLVLRLAK